MSPRFGAPWRTCAAALAMLDSGPVRVVRRSRWYWSHPVPPSDQPLYVNGVAELTTHLGPAALLARLHAVEAAMGRVRGARNAARVVDLDLLAYHHLIRETPLSLPHPRMADRAFVMVPLAELAPAWRHPISGEGAAAAAARLARQVPEEAVWPGFFPAPAGGDAGSRQPGI